MILDVKLKPNIYQQLVLGLKIFQGHLFVTVCCVCNPVLL